MDPWITPDQIPRYDEFSGKVDLVEICAGVTEILYMLSGRQYGVGTATVRPAAIDHNCGCLPWWAAAAAGSGWGGYTWPWGRWFPEGWGCGCASAKEVVLRGRNIRNLTVMADGDLLVAGSDYRVFSGRRLIRTDGHVWPCCFPAGTLVLTSDGQKPIQDVRAGDSVLTHAGRWRKVIAARQTRMSETITLQGHGGQITCTPDHPFYASEVYVPDSRRSGSWNRSHRKYGAPTWVEASDMLGQGWATPRAVESLPIPLPLGLNEAALTDDFWWFVGRWIGDGWVASTSKRVFVCAGHHEADVLEERLAESGLAWGQRHDGRTAVRFSVSHAGVHEWLTEQFGRGAAGKRLPAWLLGAPESIRRSVLDGYVSADGWRASARYGRAAFTSTRIVSRSLAIDVRLLVAGLGYSPTLFVGEQTTTHIEGRKINDLTAYRVDWNVTPPGGHLSQTWADEQHLWARVKTIDLSEIVVPVYDLEIEEDHSFVADGFVVHNCQRLDQDDTQPGTWSAKYTWGTPPPASGRIAARALAPELASALLGTDTKLPGRVTNLSRAGITAVVQEPTACLEKGFTGVSAVDTFLLAVNPMQARRQAQFVSPESRLNFREAPTPTP